MIVQELVDKLALTVAGGAKGLGRRVDGGYCGDLLSDVMGNAPERSVWLTVQSHQNIVAVAVLREMAAIVLTGGIQPDKETLEKADQEEVPVLLYPGSSFDLAVRLHQAGIGADT